MRTLFCCLFCLSGWAIETPTILVSVAPHQFLVEQIAGSTIQILLMVPEGASSHTYEPSPKQMLAASKAVVWFRLGEPFETQAVAALKSYQPKLQLVDLREGLPLIQDHVCMHAHCHDEPDPHVWLSPPLLVTQAQTITHTLSQMFPEHQALYHQNMETLHQRLETLDQELREWLAPITRRTLLVSHPAYAYFCRSYQLTQMAIEFEGKDPTPRQLTALLTQARNASINRIYIQPQYSSKGARLVAETLDVPVVSLNPYEKNVIESLRTIGKAVATP